MSDYIEHVKQFQEGDFIIFFEIGAYIICKVTKNINGDFTLNGRPIIRKDGHYDPWPRLVKKYNNYSKLKEDYNNNNILIENPGSTALIHFNEELFDLYIKTNVTAKNINSHVKLKNKYSDLKIIEELIMDLKPQSMTFSKFREKSYVTEIAMNRLKDGWDKGEMEKITLSISVYFELLDNKDKLPIFKKKIIILNAQGFDKEKIVNSLDGSLSIFFRRNVVNSVLNNKDIDKVIFNKISLLRGL